jgi:hypothetical protein
MLNISQNIFKEIKMGITLLKIVKLHVFSKQKMNQLKVSSPKMSTNLIFLKNKSFTSFYPKVSTTYFFKCKDSHKHKTIVLSKHNAQFMETI